MKARAESEKEVEYVICKVLIYFAPDLHYFHANGNISRHKLLRRSTEI